MSDEMSYERIAAKARQAVGTAGEYPADVASQTTEAELEALMSAEIDAILTRLDDGIPRLFQDMKSLQASLRRPLGL